MSNLLVPIVEISEIRPHPNADKLEIVVLNEWQVIVGKGNYKAGDRVVFIQQNLCVPQRWSDIWEVTQYLGKGGRVKCARLRGEPSFGFTVPITDLPRGGEPYETGENVAHIFDITKYVPVLKLGSQPDMMATPALLERYSDLENLRHYPDVIADGEEVVMTEKIDGTNVKVAMIGGELMVGSMNGRRAIPDDPSRSWYSYPLTITGVQEMLDTIGKDHKQVILYGETYGRVQTLHYGIENGLAFSAFDLVIDGKYVDYDTFRDLCWVYGVPVVPELYRGPFTLSQVRAVSTGDTTLGGDHIREGVVVKTVVERRDPKVGRVALKYHNADFLLSDKDEPATEEDAA